LWSHWNGFVRNPDEKMVKKSSDLLTPFRYDSELEQVAWPVFIWPCQRHNETFDA
jgi:hypothetical protein